MRSLTFWYTIIEKLKTFTSCEVKRNCICPYTCGLWNCFHRLPFIKVRLQKNFNNLPLILWSSESVVEFHIIILPIAPAAPNMGKCWKGHRIHHISIQSYLCYVFTDAVYKRHVSYAHEYMTCSKPDRYLWLVQKTSK